MFLSAIQCQAVMNKLRGESCLQEEAKQEAGWVEESALNQILVKSKSWTIAAWSK